VICSAFAKEWHEGVALLAWLAFQAQEGRIEFSRFLQARPILDDHRFSPPGDQTFLPQLLDDPVDVNGREPKGVTQLGLRQRKLETEAIGETDRLKAQKHLAEQVGGMLPGRLAADRDDPLTVDGGIHGNV
jgi:hypothetical protein